MDLHLTNALSSLVLSSSRWSLVFYLQSLSKRQRILLTLGIRNEWTSTVERTDLNTNERGGAKREQNKFRLTIRCCIEFLSTPLFPLLLPTSFLLQQIRFLYSLFFVSYYRNYPVPISSSPCLIICSFQIPLIKGTIKKYNQEVSENITKTLPANVACAHSLNIFRTVPECMISFLYFIALFFHRISSIAQISFLSLFFSSHYRLIMICQPLVLTTVFCERDNAIKKYRAQNAHQKAISYSGFFLFRLEKQK